MEILKEGVLEEVPCWKELLDEVELQLRQDLTSMFSLCVSNRVFSFFCVWEHFFFVWGDLIKGFKRLEIQHFATEKRNKNDTNFFKNERIYFIFFFFTF